MDDVTELGKKEGYAKNSVVWSREDLELVATFPTTFISQMRWCS